jgi:hypothetical protein
MRLKKQAILIISMACLLLGGRQGLAFSLINNFNQLEPIGFLKQEKKEDRFESNYCWLNDLDSTEYKIYSAKKNWRIYKWLSNVFNTKNDAYHLWWELGYENEKNHYQYERDYKLVINTINYEYFAGFAIENSWWISEIKFIEKRIEGVKALPLMTNWSFEVFKNKLISLGYSDGGELGYSQIALDTSDEDIDFACEYEQKLKSYFIKINHFYDFDIEYWNSDIAVLPNKFISSTRLDINFPGKGQIFRLNKQLSSANKIGLYFEQSWHSGDITAFQNGFGNIGYLEFSDLQEIIGINYVFTTKAGKCKIILQKHLYMMHKWRASANKDTGFLKKISPAMIYEAGACLDTYHCRLAFINKGFSSFVQISRMFLNGGAAEFRRILFLKEFQEYIPIETKMIDYMQIGAALEVFKTRNVLGKITITQIIPLQAQYIMKNANSNNGSGDDSFNHEVVANNQMNSGGTTLGLQVIINL